MAGFQTTLYAVYLGFGEEEDIFPFPELPENIRKHRMRHVFQVSLNSIYRLCCGLMVSI